MIAEFFRSLLPFLDSVPAVRAILGSILVFFLPGFAWTLVFFSGRKIKVVERLVLSLGLSIAAVTLCILALNKLLGVRITGSNSVLIILVLTFIPIVWHLLKRIIRRRSRNAV